MTVAVDQTATGISPNGVSSAVMTWATAPAAGAKVIVFVATFGTVTSVVDNGATPTTFTQDANNNDSGANDFTVAVYRADNITLPATGSYHVTVTFGGSVTAAVGGRSYTGVATGAPSSVNNAGLSSGTSVTTGNVTPTVTGSLLVGGFLTDSGANPESITLTTSGASVIFSATNGTILAGGCAHHIVTTTSAQGLAWTIGSSADWAPVAAVYAPAGGTSHTATASLTVTPSLTAASAVRVSAALTVPPSLTASRVHGNARTASLTVTPSLSAAASGGSIPPTAILTEAGGILLTEAGGAFLTEATGGTAHTASASLTVTPVLSAAAAHGNARTASLAVTPSLAAVRAAAHVRTAALTVTPVLAAAGNSGAPSFTATASLTVTPSFSAQAATGTTAALTVTPSFSASRAHGNARAAALTVTPALSATPSHASVRSASLTVTPSLSAARLHSHAVSAALTVTPALTASGSVTVPAPVIAGTWTGSYAVSSGFAFPFPAAKPMQIPVTNLSGDWLFAVISWRPSTVGAGVSVVVADDAHNWWEPVGAPSTDSGVAGAVRTAVWAAPAARVGNSVTGVTLVQVAPTGPVLSLCAAIFDVSGMLPWYQVAAIGTNEANAATSLALSASSLNGAILFSALAHDNSSVTVTGPGGGWANLATVTATNGVDHTADLEMTAAWLTTTSALTVTGTGSASGSTDLAGVIAGVLISALPPAQPNPNWPVMITEVAIGAGVQTPPSQLTWTTIAGRSLALTIQQGKQYSLGQLQAGQGTITLDDPDGALIPPGTGAYAGIDSGTPLRRRVTWPPSATPHYVAFNGLIRRWPWNMDAQMLRGQVIAEITDVWGYGNGPLNAMAIEECLLDTPHSLWPLTDPPGSTGAGNLVANGAPLPLVTSKFGSGGAVITWGANSGALRGMSSAQVTSSGAPGGASGMFSQTLAGTSLSTTNEGFALTASDPAYPPISGGVTIECWAQLQLGGEAGFTVGVGSPATFGSANFATGQALIASVASGFTFPTGITAGNAYFVVGQGGTSFQLSTVPGGGGLSISGAGAGFFTPTVPWNPVILAARGIHGTVAQLEIDKFTGHLILRYRPAAATSDTLVTVDAANDYRNTNGGMNHFSLAVTQTTWRVIANGGGLVNTSGTFSGPLPASFPTACFGGVMDRVNQGAGWTGFLALAGVYPGISAPIRVLSRYEATLPGLSAEAAPDRVERLLEYAGLTGRRWIGRELGATGAEPLENDLVVSGQDVGGQAAVSSVNNIAQSTLPAYASVAPTGDIYYRSKFYVWNEPVRWVLGDNTAGGEIPFAPGSVATDYDPSRVTADVQLTQLDTQAVTTPSGVMSATTMAAVAATAAQQYGGQPYQQTGYLDEDWSSPYGGGSSLVDLANWVQTVYAKPANRIQAVTVDAASHPAAWPFWAGAAVGDMVAVNVRLPTAATSPLISLIARITQTARASQFSQDGTSATITATLDFAPEYNALTCDDAVRGKLDGSTVLPW